jgi:hypothetical protein
MPFNIKQRLAKIESALRPQADAAEQALREARARAIMTDALVENLGWDRERLEAELANTSPGVHRGPVTPLDKLYQWCLGVLARTRPPWEPDPPAGPSRHNLLYPPGTHYLPPPAWFEHQVGMYGKEDRTADDHKRDWLAYYGNNGRTVWKRGDKVIDEPWFDDGDPELDAEQDAHSARVCAVLDAWSRAVDVLKGSEVI